MFTTWAVVPSATQTSVRRLPSSSRTSLFVAPSSTSSTWLKQHILASDAERHLIDLDRVAVVYITRAGSASVRYGRSNPGTSLVTLLTSDRPE